ncbi:MAG TPA: PEGA domain-containing protein [Polyangiaceae bacterium]|nr:PEGA domain-containing protein [Polyangiaceae bacterium]
MLSVPLPALAQNAGNAPDPTTEEGKRAEGKARYERGVEAYSAGRYKDAIDLFLQADSLAPSAALSFNIARAYEKISDDASTLQWYRDFRRRAPDAKNGPEVDEHIHQLELVLAKKGVQQLTVLSTPFGATVVVDEQPVGVTPYTGQLAPGAHKVSLRLRGYADSEHRVELAADRAQDLVVPLVPARERPATPGAGGEEPASSGEGARTATGGAVPPPPDHAASGPRFGIWPYVGLGAGALALGGALGFEMARRSAENAAKDDDTQIGYSEQLDKEKSRQTAARVFAAVGGVLVVAAGTLLVIDLTTHPKKEQARLGVACLPGSCAFDLRGQF